ncbi:MAG: Rne/Rng family ribonuclease [Pseudomonadota bacterium]
MANNKMLIDASHREETRVVVQRGNKVEEFDFESENKKQLRGNIYLAKVTRVEPSLQAAFVEYGGNRHGFLAFSEIHPDYYQIPVADRQALLDAEAEDAARERAEADAADDAAEQKEKPKRNRRRRGKKAAAEADNGAATEAEESAADAADSKTDGSSDAEAASTASADEVVADAAAPSEDGANDDAAPVAESDEQSDVAEASSESSDDADQAVVEEPSVAAESDDDKPVKTAATDGDEASSDEQDEDTPPGSIAAANESDVISEPAKTPSETADDSTEENAEARTDAPQEETASEAVAVEDDQPVVSEASADDTSTEETTESVEAASGDEAAAEAEASNDEASDDASDDAAEDDDDVESVGSEDALEEVPARRTSRRQYKIQEVIKRRQILLIQVVKEERGNKGAALTTYLSLAGRYSVLMPNTARGGGISRKITNISDRKRLKSVATSLNVPEGMGVILRTAGATRTKPEISRDFEYLMRLWENVRSLTLQSTAPCLVYEEGSLIKRSIRDLYSKDIDEVIVSGDEGYREAKDFMQMLMPSHAKNVKHYGDRLPIFTRHGVESQLDKMMQPQVTLKSGGYLVINQTEALVAIDVNSGRSTRQHSIEETALQTNLEAAEEVARQLRLRDLAGLVVIDFIDMEEKRNNRAVEKRLKEALKNDRARIQIGRISHFGLLEMSRQRIRASVLESTTQVCPTCEGVGFVLSPSSVALHVLRGIEDHLLKNNRFNIIVNTTMQTAVYILNHKRAHLEDLEQRFGVTIQFEPNRKVGNQHLIIERGEPAQRRVVVEDHVQLDTVALEHDEQPIVEDEDAEASEDRDRPKRRRRRRRKGRGGNGEDEVEAAETSDAASDADAESEEAEAGEASADAEKPEKRRRRGKRGGRKSDASEAEAQNASEETSAEASGDDSEASAPEASGSEAPADDAVVSDESAAESAAAEAPAPKRRTRRPRKKAAEKVEAEAEADTSTETESASAEADPANAVASETEAPAEAAEEDAKPKRRTRRPRKPKAAAEPEEQAQAESTSDQEPEAAEAAVPVAEAVEVAPASDQPVRKRRNTRRISAESNGEDTVSEAVAAPEPEHSEAPSGEKPEKSKRGWWQRTGFFR